MDDIALMALKKARAEVQEEIISENMLGINFSLEKEQVKPIMQIVSYPHNFGYLEMEFRKGDF